MNGTPLSQAASAPKYEYLSQAAAERALTKKGYQGHQHTSVFDAVGDYDTGHSTGIAAVLTPFWGISWLFHKEFHAANISHKEDELAALLDALLFPAEGGDSTIISSGPFDIEEIGAEVKVSSKVTGNSFTLQGPLSTLRQEWKRDVREAATSTKKPPSPKVVELYNKIVCEEAIALYQTLADGTSDWSEIGRRVIELTRTIQTDVSEGMKREEIINSAIEKLDNACPRALQDPEQANAFIR
ncbi:MAG: hypothetical protein K0R08_1364, partial [Solimicrobium sp.]|nr:hypothetical protein [Solimicrobium sp.]